jgi:hypothetical protein
MALRERVNGFDRCLQVTGNLGGGLGSRVRKAEGMQREREGFSVAPIGGVRLCPACDRGVPRRHQRLGL